MSTETPSLGDQLRRLASDHTTSWSEHGTVTALADQADVLERGGKELGRILDRELTAVLDLSGAHHLIDSDGDGDWGAVWDILGDLVAKGKQFAARQSDEPCATIEASDGGWTWQCWHHTTTAGMPCASDTTCATPEEACAGLGTHYRRAHRSPAGPRPPVTRQRAQEETR